MFKNFLNKIFIFAHSEYLKKRTKVVPEVPNLIKKKHKKKLEKKNTFVSK